MRCPDLRTLSRVGTPDADPAVVEHVASCRSCWLDWQIQQGARYLQDPAVSTDSDVHDRVIARVLLRSRHSDLPARWRDSAIFGAVVAIATLAGLLGLPAASVVIPVVPAVAYAFAAGVLGALYVKKQDERRRAVGSGVGPNGFRTPGPSLVWPFVIVAVGAAGKATAQDSRPLVFAEVQRQLVLDEQAAIGSIEGEHDAFGRVMSLAIDSRGRVVVADDLSHDLKVFELTGEYVATVGRSGEGPGEFHSPWQVQVGPGDSLYVWDPGRAAVSVFGPDYEFSRSFLVPPGWTVNSMIVHPGPEFVVSVSGTGELLPIKVLSGDGRVRAEAGPPMPQRDLAGFEDSLLGGSLGRTRDGYVYSQKSPYAVWWLDEQLGTVSECHGRPEWTTDPEEVVVRSDRGVGLRWNRFSHSVSILPLPGGHLLNTVLIPESDQRLLHVLGEGCQVISELLLDIPVRPLAVLDDLLVALRSVDYPEIVVYRMSWGVPLQERGNASL